MASFHYISNIENLKIFFLEQPRILSFEKMFLMLTHISLPHILCILNVKEYETVRL